MTLHPSGATWLLIAEIPLSIKSSVDALLNFLRSGLDQQDARPNPRSFWLFKELKAMLQGADLTDYANWIDSNDFLKDSDPAVDYQTRSTKSPGSSMVGGHPVTRMRGCDSPADPVIFDETRWGM